MPDTIPFTPTFSGKNVEAQQAAAVRAWDTHAQKVITDVSNETRDNIKNLITRSVKDGIAPRDAARLIKPMIGLTSRQGQAAMNYRSGLVARGLSADKVEKLTTKYAEKQLRSRAEMIARTETMGALNEGQKAAWRQAQSEGLLSARAEKVWLTADPCPICAPMEGERVLLGESFATGDPPIHPRCRCTFTIESDRLKNAPKLKVRSEGTGLVRVKTTRVAAKAPEPAAPKVVYRDADQLEAALRNKNVQIEIQIQSAKQSLPGLKLETSQAYTKWAVQNRLSTGVAETERLYGEYQQAAAKLERQRDIIENLRKNRNQMLHEILFKDGKATIKPRGLEEFSAEGKKRIQDGLEFVSRMLGKNAQLTHDALDFEVNQTGRAFYRSKTDFTQGWISAELKEDVNTIVHELGHWIEDIGQTRIPSLNNPAIKNEKPLYEASKQFLRKRTQGEQLVELRKLFPYSNYQPNELTWKDEFFSPYIGKYYADATEVLSMGLEQLYKDPLYLINKDPELFKHVIKLLDAAERGSVW